MSFLTDLGKTVSKAVGDIGREVSRGAKKLGPVAQLIPGGGLVTGLAGAAANLSPRRSSGGGALPTTAFPSTNQLLPALAGPIGQVARGVAGGALGSIGGDIIRTFIPGLSPGTGTAAGGCGCGSKNGRDPCTGQAMTTQPAPKATLFGGCCPPGRTLRRIGLGRDVCIKTPRMNPFNPRALARADRRVTTFARRAAPILKDMGFTVSSTRKVKITSKKRRSR